MEELMCFVNVVEGENVLLVTGVNRTFEV